MDFFLLRIVVIIIFGVLMSDQTYGQDYKGNSIILPIAKIELYDFDNEDFRWTIGLGYERLLINRLYARVVLKSEMGKYNTGKGDHRVLGNLNAFDSKFGFNYDILQLKRINIKLALYYVSNFAESKDGYGYSPNYYDYFYEKETFKGIEPGVEIEYKVFKGLKLFINGGIYYGKNTTELHTERGCYKFSNTGIYGLPILETLGIKCFF